MEQEVVQFGAFELDLASCELRRAGRRIKLALQPARVLRLLATRPGRLVTREEIRAHLWGADTFVDADLGLNYCMTAIRSALHDSARSPRYVETLPKRGYRFIAPVSANGREKTTLAVLPFANLGGDPEKIFFADGVTDALITELGRITGLRVISRQSVLHLRGSEEPLSDIARKLGAGVVVEGSVLHGGGRVRIAAQLIRIDPEDHLWADSYERRLSDVLNVQREIARAIARRIRAVLTPESRAHLSRDQPVNPEAYEAYLKGGFYMNRWSREGFEKGLDYLGRALALDPALAPAWASLAHCYSLFGFWGHMPASEAGSRAREAAAQALELDDGLAVAHAVSGWIAMQYDWDFAACEAELNRALELNPSDLVAHSAKAAFHIVRGEDDACISETREMLRLDPVSAYTNSTAAWFFVFARLYEQAKLQSSRAIDMFPDALQAWYTLGWAEAGLGNSRAAQRAFERAASISRDPISLGYLGHALAAAGDRPAAEALHAELLDRSTREFVPPKPLIFLATALGDLDRAFEVIEATFREHDGLVLWLGVAPQLDPLRRDPRFSGVLSRCNAMASSHCQ